jgi:hypothetical protein
VPVGFTIPRDRSSRPTPGRSEISLIDEKEDEDGVYVDEGLWAGTRMTAIVDKIPKVGNVAPT